MKIHFTYKWSSIHLNTECEKCGNNIVLQNFDGNPNCNECGNNNKISWFSILRQVDIIAMKRGNNQKRKLIGEIDCSVSLEEVNKIHCHHCKTIIEIPEEEEDLKNYTCNTCKKPLYFKEFIGLEDLVFYKNGATDTSTEAVKMIAVRCVSCGAPLEVNPTINNFHCKFCATDNILPMSLRYKVVLDDIFVGEKKSRLPKLQVFVKDGQIVKQALRENGKESFTDTELDKVLVNEKDDSGVYHQIMNEFKYLPPGNVLNEIFANSKSPVIIKEAGLRLQKLPGEIEKRINSVSAVKKENVQPQVILEKEHNKKKSFFKNPFFFILLIAVITAIYLILFTDIF